MESLLLYLLKSTALLSIFFLVYRLLLRNDTSFQANRHFLLWGILAAALLPAIEFTRSAQLEHLAFPKNYLLPSEATQNSPGPSAETDWGQLLGIIYLIGFGFMLLRFLFQLYSILKIIEDKPKKKEGDFSLISTNKELAPFSFFRFIVFNPKLHSLEELKIILEHEKVHASQCHSADVLLSQLVTAILWFNPLSWKYRKGMIQNLEYLADKEAVVASISKTFYQHTLLKIAVADYQPALVNNFNQPFIKKRIMMLNKKPTQEKTLWKMGVSLPLILAFIVCFQVKTEAQVLAHSGSETDISNSNSSSQTSGSEEFVADADNANVSLSPDKHTKIFPQNSTPPLIIVDGEVMNKTFNMNNIDPTDIARIDVIKGEMATGIYGDKAKNGIIQFSLKSRKISSGDAKVTETETLYVIDGEEMDHNFNPEEVNPENIKSMNVIKGEMAIAKYGDKAKKGAIEITLKD